MIPALLYLLFKKIRNQKEKRLFYKNAVGQAKKMIRTFIYVLLLLLFGSVIISAHGQKLNYKVTRDGDEIGWMKLEKICNGEHCRLTLNSTVSFRMIFLFTANVFESASFLNDKLIYSSQWQKRNGDIKVNKQTRYTGNCYEVLENDETEKLSFSEIGCNLLCLYFKEPISIQKVYCDKQQCFSEIKKTKNGGYKVKFPNGDSNCYYYTGGICSRVEIEHSFYSVEVILKP